MSELFQGEYKVLDDYHGEPYAPNPEHMLYCAVIWSALMDWGRLCASHAPDQNQRRELLRFFFVDDGESANLETFLHIVDKPALLTYTRLKVLEMAKTAKTDLIRDWTCLDS